MSPSQIVGMDDVFGESGESEELLMQIWADGGERGRVRPTGHEEANEMKIFIDTANIEQIKEVNSWGILDGVTTNPSLVAKESKDFATLVDEICQVVDGPISVEAISCKAEEIVPEARKLAESTRTSWSRSP